MNKYDVDIKKLGLMLMPTFMRKPLLAGVMYAAVSGLAHVFMRFTKFRIDSDYRLRYNGQVCHMRAVLNDMFDPFERRITITDNNERYINDVIYQRDVNVNDTVTQRNEDVYGYTVTRRGLGEINTYDFFVNLPVARFREIDLKQVAGIVNIYKLASKHYEIIFR